MFNQTVWPAPKSFRIALLCALSFFTTSVFAEEALWLATPSGALKLDAADGAVQQEILIRGGTIIEVIAVNPSTKNIWSYRGKRLRAYSPDGTELVNTFHESLESNRAAKDIHVDSNGVWLSKQKRLHKFNLQGELEFSIDQGAFSDITLDRESNLWAETGDKIDIYSTSDVMPPETPTPILERTINAPADTTFYEIAYDPSFKESIEVWVYGYNKKTRIYFIKRYNLAGEETASHELGSITRDGKNDFYRDIQPDGSGGLWGRGGRESITHLNAAGEVRFGIQPFKGLTRPRIRSFIANPEDQTVWVANNGSIVNGGQVLKKYAANGGEMDTVIPDLGDGWPRDAYDMAIELKSGEAEAPAIEIMAPAAGSTVTTNTPTIEIRLTDNDGGMDMNSIEAAFIQENGRRVQTLCNFDEETSIASCTSIPVADGEVTIVASIADANGNNRTSATPVAFIVDTQPITVEFISPAEGFATPEDSQEISVLTNERPQSLSVSVNDVALPDVTFSRIDGSEVRYKADIPLSELGDYTVTVTAHDFDGSSATVSRTITRRPYLAPTIEFFSDATFRPLDGSIRYIVNPLIVVRVTDDGDGVDEDSLQLRQVVDSIPVDPPLPTINPCVFNTAPAGYLGFCQLEGPIPEGVPYTLSATIAEPTGNARSEPIQATFTVELGPVVEIAHPHDNQEALSFSEIVLRVTINNPNARLNLDTVELQVNDNIITTAPCTEVFTRQQDPRIVTCVPTQPLPRGRVTLTATIADILGDRSDPAQVRFVVVI